MRKICVQVILKANSRSYVTKKLKNRPKTLLQSCQKKRNKFSLIFSRTLEELKIDEFASI